MRRRRCRFWKARCRIGVDNFALRDDLKRAVRTTHNPGVGAMSGQRFFAVFFRDGVDEIKANAGASVFSHRNFDRFRFELSTGPTRNVIAQIFFNESAIALSIFLVINVFSEFDNHGRDISARQCTVIFFHKLHRLCGRYGCGLHRRRNALFGSVNLRNHPDNRAHDEQEKKLSTQHLSRRA